MIKNSFRECVNYLNNPYLVTRVQQFFGVRLIGVVRDDEGSNPRNLNNLNNETADLNSNSSSNIFSTSDDRTVNETDVTTTRSLLRDSSIRTVKLLDNKKCLYQINNIFFYYFFQFITKVGNEIFYIVFLPCISWFYDDRISYLATLSWSIMMFAGQAAKDIIKLPRPQTPPVVKMEDRYLLEFGFPSTHAMAILNISITFTTLLIQSIHSNEYAWLKILVAVTMATITFLVCLSRVYLGMHSFLDILGGLCLSLAWSFLFLRFSSDILWFIQQGIIPGLLQTFIIVLMCMSYPCRDRWSPAREDTFLIMGVAVGISLGMGLKSELKINDMGKYKCSSLTGSYIYLLMILRFIVGIIPVVLVRFASKQLIYSSVKWIYCVKDGSNVKVKEFIRTRFYLEIFYNVFCYANVSFAAFFTSFWVFSILKIY
jgi:membrane-associated phospholipid phosphatase